MNEVFKKTRELADCIMESDEFRAMKDAERDAMRDPEAAHAMSEYLSHKSSIEDLLSAEDLDSDALREHTQAMEDWQQKLSLMDSVSRMTQAKQQFAQLIAQVNQVLRFSITGEMGEGDSEGGCGGAACAHCPGGCKAH